MVSKQAKNRDDIMARLVCNQAGFKIYLVSPPSPRRRRSDAAAIGKAKDSRGTGGDDQKEAKK